MASLNATSSADGTTRAGDLMSRVQLALNVADLDAAVEFYGKLFDAEPAKRRPGYANFAIASPPLKLVLIENADVRGSGVVGALNHLGVEVESPAEVSGATRRLTGEGLDTLSQDNTTCCYAVQDKVWVHDPDGAPWEVYTVLADAPESGDLRGDPGCATDATGACVPTATTSADVAFSAAGVPLASSTAAGCCP
jgi:catechol 2,3-dioxygenase-like lactoylglutathione lyase family enzyme